MAYTGKTLRKYSGLLLSMPPGIWFDTETSNILSFQAPTNEEARIIRDFFPGRKWERVYDGLGGGECQWWEWRTNDDGDPIRIFGIHETPKTCTAIYETRKVKKMVPVAHEEREVEVSVIVGWDCGEEKGVTKTQGDSVTDGGAAHA